MPVKYSSVEPDSINSAASFCSPISCCTLAMRACRSATDIGLASTTSDLKVGAAWAARASAVVASPPAAGVRPRLTAAAAAPNKRLRLESMIHPPVFARRILQLETIAVLAGYYCLMADQYTLYGRPSSG